MGVRGLWRLLLPIGRRISIETLEGKILAIDASIWLTQFLKAMRDPETGSVRPAAHLIGFFRRLCKLRYHGIRPVLVFDGATPEIKKRELQQRRQRREQIFSSHEQNTVQRMAKRLLVAELKKKKQQKGNKKGSSIVGVSGSFAPGFQLTEEEHEEMKDTAAKQEEEEATAAAKADSTEDAQTQMTENDTIELLAELEDTKEEAHKDETDNNWDTIVIDKNPSQEETSADEEYTPDVASSNNDEPALDPDRIGALSSHDMKDAIEDARRQQRMRSRREFMPVAAKPEDYSQCQLRNFLRSSRLNRDIQTMAARVSQQRESGAVVGERLASDATRRIIFTRDTDVSPREEAFGQTTRRTRGLVTAQKQSRWSDDEENEWEDPDAKGVQASNTRATSAAGVHPPTGEAREKGDDDSSIEEEGGFLVSHAGNVGGVGGFLAGSPSDHHAKLSETDRIARVRTNGFGSHEAMVDSRELSDELIARAIHESEVVGTEGVASIDGDAVSIVVHPEHAGLVDDSLKDEEASRAVVGTDLGNKINSDGDSSEEDVVWEDGDDDAAVESPVAATSEAGGEYSSSLLGAKGNDPDGEARSKADSDAETTGISTRGSSVKNRPSDSSSISMKMGEDEDEENATKAFLDEEETSTVMSTSDIDRAHDVDATTAALKHAQATASNLTDWAGRAFRLAIAKHAEETGSSLNLAPDSGKKDRSQDPNNDTHVRATPTVTTQRETSHQQPSTIVKGVSIATTGRGNVEVARQFMGTIDDTHDTVKHQQDAVELLRGPIAALQDEEFELSEEMNRQERDMDTVTDEMKQEIIALLQLFGIPYVEAPAEAEAQCSMLEELGLVDGVVTEDSDVFVFGGKKVYKNIFDDQKYVEAYLAQDAEKELALGRNEFVALAMLLGGDYTDGVKGVGIVNGMEVLQAFDVSADIKQGLCEFRQWLDGFDPKEALQSSSKDAGISAREAFTAKHKSARNRWTAPTSFPADSVLNAYRNPVVDNSRQQFSWGVPDLENLIVFCRRHMGWDTKETEQLVTPVLKKLESGSRQTRMESFFMKYEDDIKFAKVNSKRLRDVFRGVRNSRDEPARERSQTRHDDSTTENRKKRKAM